MFEKIFGSSGRSTLIDAAFNDISEMLSVSEKMLDLALSALLDNQTLEVDLDQMDDRVDEGERMVRRSVLEHLSFNPQQDLVASLVLVSMVQDAERIGDFARGLTELIPLADRPREGRFRDELRALTEGLRPLFGQCEKAFREGDAELGREVMTAASGLKESFLVYTREIAASDMSASMAVVYSGAARSLRRIGSHLSNIASSSAQPYDRIRHGDEDT